MFRFGTLCLLVAVTALAACADGRPTPDAAPPTGRSPVPTDAAPVTTDAAPVTTDAAPVTTDAAPVTTDVAPVTTDVAPVTTDVAARREELARTLDEALAGWSEQNDVVGAVALIRDGDVIVRAATGTRSVNSSEPITVDDEFAIGSIMKPIAAVAVLQLADAGVLSIDDSVADYVAGVPAPITIRDLLGHTSGFRDPVDDSMNALLHPETRRTRAEQIADIVAAGPAGTRGPPHTYAYVNFLLLDEVIAAATVSTFEEQVARLILQPLDMDSSGFEPDVGDLAAPHERPAPGQPPLDLSGFNIVEMVRSSGAAGALYSTVDDLDDFVRAVFDGNFFADDTVRQLTTPIVPGADYGLGLGIYDSSVGVSYGHNGRIIGYHASLRHDPERELTAIVLTNDGTAPTEQLVTTLMTSVDD